MLTLYPEDPQLQRFSQRFAGPTFDPTTIRPIISPRTQMKPVMPSMPSVMTSVEDAQPTMPTQIEQQHQQQQRIPSPTQLNSPHLASILPTPMTHINSPKRPLDEAFDDSSNPQPRKLARGESPALKGAAGRRLESARRNLGNTPVISGPTPLAREINFLLSIIPPAHTYKETRFRPEAMVEMLRLNAQIPVPQVVGARYAAGGGGANTAMQLASIQEKYGGGSVQGHGHGQTGSLGSLGGWGQ
jgi:cleavage stimulation factor subunit 3